MFLYYISSLDASFSINLLSDLNLSNPISNVHLFAYNSFKSSVENSYGVKFVANIFGSLFPISTNVILISNRPFFCFFF